MSCVDMIVKFGSEEAGYDELAIGFAVGAG